VPVQPLLHLSKCGTKIEIIFNERVYSRGFLIANRCGLKIRGRWMKSDKEQKKNYGVTPLIFG
jgi:hypothetical protein